MKLRLLLVFLFLSLSASVKIFLIGGALADDNFEVLDAISKSTSRMPSKNCSSDWDTTPCPRIAVIVSASTDSKAGRQEF